MAKSAFIALLAALLLSAATFAQTPTWPFTYPAAPLRPGALLDLRSLNDSTAGIHGFLRKTPDGDFVFADGTPARFWCANADYRHPMNILRQQAAFLAKIGVNMVRLHTAITPKTPGADITDVDEQELDFIWRAVAANKQQGIYTTISPYWANDGFLGGQTWGIEGYPDKTDLWGLLFFNPRLQEGYRAWVKALYTRVNPYTNIPLAQDPAVAIIQIQNEDSLLFWTLNNIKPPQKKLLGKLFGDWTLAKYGSFDKAFTAWNEASDPLDDPAAGVLGIMNLWFVGQPLDPGRAQRLDDQLQFLAQTQHDFYAGLATYYRQTLGCGQLINASNWITADAVRLNDLERWTYTPTDVMAVNRYYNGGVHMGPDNGWRIDPGDFFQDQSALKNPRQFPTNIKQTPGWPIIITESTWVSPLEYQSEGPFLMAAYQSLTGVDGYYWFVCTDPGYVNPYFTFLNIRGQHPMQKWTCSTPSLEGNFPAAALLYRKGYLRRGEPAVRESRPLDDLFHRQIPAIAEDPTFDPNRNTGDRAGASNLEHGINPLAFLVGPVQTSIGPRSLKTIDLDHYIDADKKIIHSDTNQLTLNYDTGLCIMDSPKAQGVCGFLSDAGGQWNLSTVSIQSTNRYASILIVSMDDAPLSQSRKILIQIGALSRPTDWQTEPAQHRSSDGKEIYDGQTILNTGHWPWRIDTTQATLHLNNSTITKATLLDTAGFADSDVPITRDSTGIKITLPPDSMYLILSAN